MIDTDELQLELDKTQGAFKKWAVATGRTAQECKASFMRNIRAASGAATAAGGGAAGRRVVVRASLSPLSLRMLEFSRCALQHAGRPRSHPPAAWNAGDVETLNERYHKLERQAAEVQQCERPAAAQRRSRRKKDSAHRRRRRRHRPVTGRVAEPQDRLSVPAPPVTDETLLLRAT